MLSDRCLSVLSCNVGVLWPNGFMDQDLTWYGGSLGLGPCAIMLDGDPAHPAHGKGPNSHRHFSAHFALARSPISATADLLLHFAPYAACSTLLANEQHSSTTALGAKNVRRMREQRFFRASCFLVIPVYYAVM